MSAEPWYRLAPRARTTIGILAVLLGVLSVYTDAVSHELTEPVSPLLTYVTIAQWTLVLVLTLWAWRAAAKLTHLIVRLALRTRS